VNALEPSAAAPTRRPATPIPPLERRVLAELASGRTNAEIAARLGYSASYIKDVVAAARARLGARDRAHAAALAVAWGLVEPDPGDAFVATSEDAGTA
jgi:DNA-binding CsgD family transcriptional regulator